MTEPGAVAPSSVAVVGLGLIGGSLCQALRRRLPAMRIVGVTQNSATAKAALSTGVCDASGPGGELLADVEVAVLCTPVEVMPGWLRTCAAASPTLLVTDAGSTKAWVVAQAEPLLGERFLGGHPMAGRERSGWEAADPELFGGCTWVLSPTRPEQLGRFAVWRTAVRVLGAHIEVLDPAAHDAAAAVASHLPFTLSAALMRAAAASAAWDDAGWLLAATGMRDMARLCGGDPGMEASILATNTAPVLAALDALVVELDALRDAIASPEELRTWFAQARELRASWLQRRAQAHRPLP